ncbi:hypothetical protein LI055_08795 [Clostridium perfringens]|uniref:ComEC/Rec2 family competence protein n=1 Tax=Clostridium perfringens TaxID=1502 RepID=UPI001C85F21F|nr:MBL fold metallo-hydrolase [Clostridium perfringens]MCX0379718.1 hypothetical protein [Clostridium perfringens]
MDSLLRGKKLSFSIDEIYKKEDGLYGIKIIPEIESEYFPPYHLRNINVKYSLLEKKFYEAINKGKEVKNKHFKGSVVQGGYYSIETTELRNMRIFNSKTIITDNNDIFVGKKIESPYNKKNIRKDKVLTMDKGCKELSKPQIQNEGNLYLYCFNVGQGDSFLLITTNKSAYLIDTNIYTEKRALNFYNQIKKILNEHNISKLTGFIVTHKHIDHIRGADKFISYSGLEIDSFLINMDYSHETKVVDRLLKEAELKILKWININSPGIIRDGNTEIIFRNPDNATSTVINAPDINDSSIVICVKYKNTMMYLTGDASYSVLNCKLNKCTNSNCVNMLKISHHGSRTGTDSILLNNLNPIHAFISAGNNKKFNHPHTQVINLLKNKATIVNISKIIKTTICYKSNGSKISLINNKISEDYDM